MTMMKRNGERMQPCRTRETISKNSVYPLALTLIKIQELSIPLPYRFVTDAFK